MELSSLAGVSAFAVALEEYFGEEATEDEARSFWQNKAARKALRTSHERGSWPSEAPVSVDGRFQLSRRRSSSAAIASTTALHNRG